MNPVPERRGPFLLAYSWLRRALISVSIAPGDQIVVTDTSKLLAISPTPVREALSRLAGEQLVEDRRHFGYFAPLPSSIDLRAQHDVLELHLLGALRTRQKAEGPRAEPTVSGGGPTAIDDLRARYEAVLALSSNRDLQESALRCLARLAAAHRTEMLLFGPDPFRDRLCVALGEGDWDSVARIIRASHRA